MTPKETADIYMKVADYAAARHDRRRDFEWKLSFALWAVLLAPYWSTKQISFALPFPPFLLALTIALSYAFLWLGPIWRANESDKSLARYSWRTAEEIARTGKAEPSTPPSKTEGSLFSLGFFQDGAMRVHLLITLFLAALFVRTLQ
jgi:hypothetical protein